MSEVKRIDWIDYIKAFTCFLVVLGHLLQSLLKAKIVPIGNINIIEFIIWFIYLFHMPLFIAISGYLYFVTKKKFSWKNYKEFELKKIINLFVPYIVFYVLYMLLNTIFSDSVNETIGMKGWLGIINKPISPYWFLYALLSIFLIYPLIEKLCKENKYIVFIVFSILKIIAIFIDTNIYFVDSIMSYGIYFSLGTILFDKTKCGKVLILLMSILYVVISIFTYIYVKNSYINKLLNICFAIAGIWIMINLFKGDYISKILDSFKKYTFQIFLLHTFFSAGTRIVLLKVGITSFLIHLIVGMATGIYLSVIVSIISEKIKFTQVVFYPIKTINELREVKQND